MVGWVKEATNGGRGTLPSPTRGPSTQVNRVVHRAGPAPARVQAVAAACAKAHQGARGFPLVGRGPARAGLDRSRQEWLRTRCAAKGLVARQTRRGVSLWGFVKRLGPECGRVAGKGGCRCGAWHAGRRRGVERGTDQGGVVFLALRAFAVVVGPGDGVVQGRERG